MKGLINREKDMPLVTLESQAIWADLTAEKSILGIYRSPQGSPDTTVYPKIELLEAVAGFEINDTVDVIVSQSCKDADLVAVQGLVRRFRVNRYLDADDKRAIAQGDAPRSKVLRILGVKPF